jgi:DNA-binding GntR family transcriptional regulator
MRTRYVHRVDGEPVMTSVSWEPLELTGRTPVMLPEEGPLAGRGVVARMAAIDVVVDNIAEEVYVRPGRAEETAPLGGVPGRAVLAVERTHFAGGRPVETADVVMPADGFRLGYRLSVR